MSESQQNFIGDDKRQFPRWSMENRLFFRRESNPNEFLGYTRDISCTGTCFLSKERIRQGQRIKMSIYLSEAESITLHGRVMWIRREDDDFCCGIHFTDINQDEQAFILEHAYEVNQDKVVNHWFKDWNG